MTAGPTLFPYDKAGFQRYVPGAALLRVFDPEYRIRKAMERLDWNKIPQGKHLSSAMHNLLRSACGRVCFVFPISSVLSRMDQKSDAVQPKALVAATLIAFRPEQGRVVCRVQELYCVPSRGGPAKGPLYPVTKNRFQELADAGFTNVVIGEGNFAEPLRRVLLFQTDGPVVLMDP